MCEHKTNHHDHFEIVSVFGCDVCCIKCHIEVIDAFVKKPDAHKEAIYLNIVYDNKLYEGTSLNTVLCVMHLCYKRPRRLLAPMLYYMDAHYYRWFDMLKIMNSKYKQIFANSIVTNIYEDKWDSITEVLSNNCNINYDDLYTMMLKNTLMYLTEYKHVHKWFIDMKTNVYVNTEIITKMIVIKGFDHETYKMFVDLGFEFTERQISILNTYGKIDPNAKLDPFIDIINIVIKNGKYSSKEPLGYAIMRCVYDKNIKPEYLDFDNYYAKDWIKKMRKIKNKITFDHVLQIVDCAFMNFKSVESYVPDENINIVFRYIV